MKDHEIKFAIGLKAVFKVLCDTFPHAGAWISYRLWFKTCRRKRHSREKMLLKQAKKRMFAISSKKVVEFVWGSSSQKILLVHGWGSQATHFYVIIHGLLKAGYKVISLDLPGHGESSGHRTDFFEITKAIETVAQSHSHFEAIISHSFGSAPVSYLLNEQRLNTEKLIMISPIADYRYLMQKFTKRFGLKSTIENILIRKLENRFGENMWQAFSPMENLNGCTIPILIVHDKDDAIIPVNHGEQMSNLFQHSTFYKTEGLGHQDILLAQSVVKTIVHFLNCQQP